MKPFNIKKEIVTAKSRTLKATWTVEKAQDISSVIDDNLAKILQEEIDREVLNQINWEFIKSKNWIEVKIPAYSDKIPVWCESNLKHDYKEFDKVYWYFESEQDATMFTLRWSSKYE